MRYSLKIIGASSDFVLYGQITYAFIVKVLPNVKPLVGTAIKAGYYCTILGIVMIVFGGTVYYITNKEEIDKFWNEMKK